MHEAEKLSLERIRLLVSASEGVRFESEDRQQMYGWVESVLVQQEYARRVGLIVTFEDHVLMGGFGSATIECLSSRNLRVPVVRIGWPDAFIEHGKVDQLRQKYGHSVEAALEQSRPFLKALPRKRFAVTG